MWYGLVFFPEVKHKGLREFRKKYDPTYPMENREHMTLMYPVPGKIGFEDLDAHLNKILEGWRSFEIRFRELYKSWDHWLMLVATEGKEKTIALHDSIYTGNLRPYLRKDLPYRPYIGLGLFAGEDYNPLAPEMTEINQELYDKAYREAESMDLDFRVRVETLSLVKGSSMGSGIMEVKEYLLGN